MEGSDRALQQQLPVQPGVLLGIGGLLCRNPTVTVRTTVVGGADVFIVIACFVCVYDAYVLICEQAQWPCFRYIYHRLITLHSFVYLAPQASTPCVVGYLDLTTMDILFLVDPRFNRVLVRNYFMSMMSWMKPTVPFLRYVVIAFFMVVFCVGVTSTF